MKIGAFDEGMLPLLVNYSVARTGEDSLPGYYDTNQHVWVIKSDHDVIPIIEAARDLVELETKTFAEPERDDNEPNVFLEAVTKTEAKPERDDLPKSSVIDLLQLVTKTKVQSERDD